MAALAVLACPACRGQLLSDEAAGPVRCSSCSRQYRYQNGIWRFLLPEQADYYRPFLETYHPARQADGWEQANENYYLALPEVARDGPHSVIWRIRRRSYTRLMKIAGPGQGHYALDLGAGCGWLSRRLAEAGWRTLALDLNVEGHDGLEGGEIYLQKAGISFARMQASMTDLPLQDNSLALCVANGSFHYSPPELTLPEIYRALVPGGCLVICDSPVYSQAAAGQAMVAGLVVQLQAKSGVQVVWPGGSGYLLLDETLAQLQKCGFKVKLEWLERPWNVMGRLARRILHPQARQHARFPLFVAYK